MNGASRYVTVGVLLAVIAACQGATVSTPSPAQPTAAPTGITNGTATPAPTSLATAETTLPPTPGVTASPTSTPTSLPSVLPSASPTPPAPAPAGLVIDWRERGGDHGFGTVFDDSDTRTFHSGAVFANRYYIAGAMEDEDYNQDRGLWSSADGLLWEREDLPNMTEVYQTAANAAGLLVLGDGFWLTTNGSDWMQIAVSDAPDHWISGIGATSAGFVAFGSGAWTSIDGVSWTPMIEPSGMDLAAAGVVEIVSHGERLVALTGGGDGPFCCGPLQVWTSTPLTAWTRVATLPGTRRVFDAVLAGGPLGWIVAGSDYDSGKHFMWFSPEGVTWEQLTPPIGPISDVFVDDVGFVAVGFLFIGTGCALDPSDIQGLTWTSTDGRTWTAMPLEEFLYKRIDHLFRDGRTLIGIGLSYDPEVGTSNNDGVWTTRLPSTAPAGPGPTPAPTPTPDPGGCGPG